MKIVHEHVGVGRVVSGVFIIGSLLGGSQFVNKNANEKSFAPNLRPEGNVELYMGRKKCNELKDLKLLDD